MMTDDPYGWVVWNLNEPDSRGPAWGPMSKGEADALTAGRPELLRTEDHQAGGRMTITKPRRITVSEKALLLVQRLNWAASEDDPSVLCVDTKRPFGNSDWRTDVAEILGWPPFMSDDEADEQARRADVCMEWMRVIVPVLVRENGLAPGTVLVDEGRGWVVESCPD